jgi:hypothetical protein
VFWVAAGLELRSEVVKLLLQFSVDPGRLGQVALDFGHRPEQGLLAVVGLGLRSGGSRRLITPGASGLEGVRVHAAQGDEAG